MTDPLLLAKQFAGDGDVPQLQATMTQYHLSPDSLVHEHFSLLHIAAQRAQPGVLSFLLQGGANVNIKDSIDHTPLHFAAGDGNLECVKVLVEHGADINAVNNETMFLVAKMFPVYVVGGRTPLHMAAENGELECVKYLVEKGADVNMRDFNGYTPFHLASMQKHHTTAEFLNPSPGEPLVAITSEEFLWRWEKDYMHTGRRVAHRMVGHVDGMTRDCCHGCAHLISLISRQ